MKNVLKLILACLTCVTLFGCAQDKSDRAYTINLAGVDVVVGETKVGALQDSDYEFDFDFDQKVSGELYYTNLSMYRKGEKKSVGSLEVYVEEDTELKNGIIACVNFLSIVGDESSFDGVKMSELTHEKAKEHVIDAKFDENDVWIPRNKYSLRIAYENGKLKTFKHAKVYKVDWRS